jgi:signal transduction histidine kinase
MTRRANAPGVRGLSIEYWLLIANAFVVLVPAFGLLFLRLWDSHLVRITEERLIAEAAMLADAWRVELAGDAGRADDVASPPAVRARLKDGYTVSPPPPPVSPSVETIASPSLPAALRIAPLVRGVAQRHSSEVELLDAQGCVLAGSDMRPGTCLDDFPEVISAVQGTYMAVTRAPAPLARVSLDQLKRYRSVLVYVALPVWSGARVARVAGVVRMSARSSGPLEAAWDHRGTVALALLACVLFMLAITHFLSRVISRPVQALTVAAEAVARGEAPATSSIAGLAPAELRSLQNAVGRMTEQLTDRAQYIAGFATNVSHELKTPITGIRGAVELLRDDWSGMSEEQRRRFLDNIDADAQRMERLVTRLLQLARIQSEPEAAESIELRPFFARLSERYGEQVRMAFNGAPATIVMNADHLETATRNLIDNALRHGHGKPVDVSIGGKQGRVVIAVRDYGSGISAGNRSRIFDRFFTTERDRGGTGLGLAIVQAVAETRGGKITFETSPNGSTFVLTV